MDPERWQRMWEFFHEALEQAPEERDAFLDRVTADDAELRREVERQLADHNGAPSVLDPLVSDDDGTDTDPLIGTRIGAYRLDAVIGRGGMGTVYAASQEEPIRRSVALKLIKLGMDTAEVVACFSAERQALALMDHPNIATVHDAGATDEGRPYFVMELVDGLPILEFCDRTRMAVNERLELFLPVCLAVQHAHQKGVIHRDLKPSNILVSVAVGSPVPKIIDFGIAKAVHHQLTDHSLATVRGQLIGTPAYMSPEQASGAPDVDTRADVYSLGVVLYELLAGCLPVDENDPDAAGAGERAFRDSDVKTPSGRLRTPGAETTAVAHLRSTDEGSLRKQLKGDLDWIVMRALENDRDRRYATAAELAADLSRHLRHEPVVAGPPTVSYRFKKFLRRHRVGVAVSVSLILALLLGTAGTTWMAIVAHSERRAAEAARDQAREEAETARAVITVLDEILSAPDPMGDFATAGAARDVKVIEVLDRANDFLPGLAERPAVEAALRRTLGKTYLGLGQAETAEVHFRRALELNTLAFGPEHPDSLASSHHLAWALRRLGRLEEAEEILQEVVDQRRRVLGPEHHDTLTALNSLVLVLSRQGKHDEAQSVAREAVRMSRLVNGEDHPRTLHALGNLATALEEGGALEEAEEAFRELVALNRQILGESHPDTLLSMQNLAAVLTQLDRRDQAASLFREVLETYRETLGASHPNVLVTGHNLARTLTDMGEADEAVVIYGEILDLARQRFGPDHYLVATSEGGLGTSLLRLGRFAEAEVQLVRSHERLAEVFGTENRRTATAQQRLAELYEAWDRPEMANRYR